MSSYELRDIVGTNSIRKASEKYRLNVHYYDDNLKFKKMISYGKSNKQEYDIIKHKDYFFRNFKEIPKDLQRKPKYRWVIESIEKYYIVSSDSEEIDI